MPSLVALAIVLAAAPFGPGPLSSAHAMLEGPLSCTRCHEAGAGTVSAGACLVCHEPLRRTVERSTGLHGRLEADRERCQRCHREHRGRDGDLLWNGADPRTFEHARSGFALQGAHRRLRCTACHEPRRTAEDVRPVFARSPDRSTYLGLDPACSACHFDEHRGELAGPCDRCHDAVAWKPAPRFEHAGSRYPLDGAHARARCDRCHPRSGDLREAPSFPAPRSPLHTVYRPVAHGACVDCHRERHRAPLGERCQTCHTTGSWRDLQPMKGDRAFHARTGYPLRGAHAGASCAGCHGGLDGAPRRPVPAAARCSACHVDAHAGQLGAERPEGGRCDRCHGLAAFAPARFEMEDHATTRFPLRGAHRTVPCDACHPRDVDAERAVPQEAVDQLARDGRPVRTSRVRLRLAALPGDCRACHRDPHAGQFDARLAAEGCSACHTEGSMSDLRFDHGRDARFPLAGRHARTPCSACHVAPAPGAPVRYRPLDQDCGSCHADPHAGQLRDARGAPSCDRCHPAARPWREPTFRHEPPFTTYLLSGRHAQVRCDRCHDAVMVAPGVQVKRYRPVPRRCDGCHADPHAGAAAGPGDQGGGRGCARCHGEATWAPTGFDHAAAGLALAAGHAGLACDVCHASATRPGVRRTCAVCHADPHRGALGARCDRCHEARDWEARFAAADHRSTALPLDGRHASLPCESCHAARRDPFVERLGASCASCHLADHRTARVGPLPHEQAGLGLDCGRCHDAWSFGGAALPGHEVCFETRYGPHAGATCESCHVQLLDLRRDGSCSTFSAACTRCHDCDGQVARHATVPGYLCADRRCYECHRFDAAAP